MSREYTVIQDRFVNNTRGPVDFTGSAPFRAPHPPRQRFHQVRLDSLWIMLISSSPEVARHSPRVRLSRHEGIRPDVGRSLPPGTALKGLLVIRMLVVSPRMNETTRRALRAAEWQTPTSLKQPRPLTTLAELSTDNRNLHQSSFGRENQQGRRHARRPPPLRCPEALSRGPKCFVVGSQSTHT